MFLLSPARVPFLIAFDSSLSLSLSLSFCRRKSQNYTVL